MEVKKLQWEPNDDFPWWVTGVSQFATYKIIGETLTIVYHNNPNHAITYEHEEDQVLRAYAQALDFASYQGWLQGNG